MTQKTSPGIATVLSKGGRAALFCGALAAGCARVAAQENVDYRVHVGDVIEIGVAGVSALSTRNSVQADGVVSLPLVGGLKVEGETLAEMRVNIQSRLSQKVFHQRAADGREYLVAIQPDDVSAAIIEYRPVYINGDVAKPGALTYRSGMTARQAIAMAGGVDIESLRSLNPAIDMATVKAEYETTCIQLARGEARLQRINSELNGSNGLSRFAPGCAAIPRTEADQIEQGESQVMQARLRDYHRQQDYLRASMAQLSARTAVVEKQQQEEEKGARADDEDLQRMISLLKQGNVANPRVLEARRALLMSQTRALQVADGLLLLKKQATDAARQLQHLDDDRNANLLTERGEAEANVAEMKAKIDAEIRKLSLLSLSRSRLLDGNGSQTNIRLVREIEYHSTTKTIDGDFQLEPGDVVEVLVKATID